MTTAPFFYGTGRRKTAVARVRLVPGSGEIVVNDRTLEAHFGNAIDEADVRMPFRVTGTTGGGSRSSVACRRGSNTRAIAPISRITW